MLDRRMPIWEALLLGVLAVAELAGRMAGLRVRQVDAQPTVAAVHLNGTDVRTTLAGVVAVVLVSLLGTWPAGFLRPGAAVLTAGAASTYLVAAYHVLTVAGLLVLLHTAYLAGRSGGWARVVAGLLPVPFLVVALAGFGGAYTHTQVIVLVALTPAAAVAGAASRIREETSGAVARAAAGVEFEHLARGERARIARELHDVVAHHISMVAVQAETARLATPGMPELGARRLREIGDTARAGLTEMRRLLGVLRDDAAAGAEAPVPVAAARQPQPGLGELTALLDSAREASGTGIRLIVSGPVTRLDPGTELAVYRIVQEALTNARRHAPGAAVDVELHYRPRNLLLRVRDNGPGSASAGSIGHGLVGMRERAQAAGGSLRTGPAPAGGFLVEALFPAVSSEEGVA